MDTSNEGLIMLNKYKDDCITLLLLLGEYFIYTILFSILFTAIDFVTMWIKDTEFILTSDIIVRAFFIYLVIDLLSTKYIYTKRWIKENA